MMDCTDRHCRYFLRLLSPRIRLYTEMLTAAAIVRGGFEKLREAGCVLLGGHSVRDAEIKFGYAVTGLVDPRRMLTNAGGRPGQVLVLTKPLGTGIIATVACINGDDQVALAGLLNALFNLCGLHLLIV